MGRCPTGARGEGRRPSSPVPRQMGDELPGRAAGGDKLIDAAFDVGAYHCACVLAMDVEEAA